VNESQSKDRQTVASDSSKYDGGPTKDPKFRRVLKNVLSAPLEASF
jgi:hypothetical protein